MVTAVGHVFGVNAGLMTAVRFNQMRPFTEINADGMA